MNRGISPSGRSELVAHNERRPKVTVLQPTGALAVNARKYINRYAEPEARLSFDLTKTYDSALVLPAHDEPANFHEALAPALLGRQGLLILVVNATSSASATVHAANQALMDQLLKSADLARQVSATPPIYLIERAGCDVLMLNRAVAGHFLPEKQGVGLARRIGSDVALSVKLSGALSANGFGCTDADVCLPRQYFDAGERALLDAAAAIFPFTHEPNPNAALSRATAAYELSLRYLLLGLCFAGSSYAYHSLGSALYLSFPAYADVRGFPKRQAGEDFYVLDKIAKQGKIRRLSEPTIAIRTRASARVPFGTGPGVRQLLEQSPDGSSLSLYHPESFYALRELLSCFKDFAHTRDLAAVRSRLCSAPVGGHVLAYLASIDFERALVGAALQSKTSEQLTRRLKTWFDALRTLKFLHALRDGCHPKLGWQKAIDTAEFVPIHAKKALLGKRCSDGHFEVLEALRAHEHTLPELVGVTCPEA
jgi:hypothetical protein